MIFKQQLLTVLLGVLFAVALTDQASALYDPGVGRFCSRDPIGYEDGNNLQATYFVPQSQDPFGKYAITKGKAPPKRSICDCCDTAVQDLIRLGIVTKSVKGPGGRDCPVSVHCNEGCDGGAPGYCKINRTTIPPNIVICIDCRMANLNLEQTIAHEMQHARDLCAFPNLNTNTLQGCIWFETRGCEVTCGIRNPNGGPDFDACVNCCVYFSCRHHRGMQKPSTTCDLTTIPTKPCWKYDPELRRFVPDDKDPRCRKNHPKKKKKPSKS